VQVGRDLLKTLGEEVNKKLPDRVKCAVLTDSNVGPLYAEKVLESLRSAGKEPHLITVPAGESSKSLTWSESVLSEMVRFGLDRKSFLVALGGGVIGDLGGFCAAIYQRGIPYIQVPTTVLSQVDSSIGGKTGVNLSHAKNMVGCFHQPMHVVADLDTLNSLPRREWNEGFAEIIKHACIRDASMFDAINNIATGNGNLVALIRRNIAIKAAIVEADEFETIGTRALLNFGHTLGHAIEAAAGYGRLLHGEAISLGLRAAAWLSAQISDLTSDDYERVISLLKLFDLPTRLPDDLDTEEILRIARTDKKFESCNIRFVLIRKIGEAYVSKDIIEGHLKQALDELRK
jgi:3-dehydroquinate synthase